MPKTPKLSWFMLVATQMLLSTGCGESKATGRVIHKNDRKSSTTEPVESGTGDSKGTHIRGEPTKQHQVLGLFGGYLSCSSNQDAPLDGTRMVRFLNLINAQQETNGAVPGHFVSCFGVDPSVVNFMTSDEPNKVRKLPVQQFIQEFQGMIRRTEQPEVHIVGHSYGGWLSLQIANSIRSENPLSSLTTIDPISHLLCTPPDVINSLVGNPVKPACNQAPADLPDEDLAQIAERAKTWINFYQTDANLLHSGSLNGAENVKLNFPAAPIDPHTHIADDQLVISKVLERIIGN